MSPTSSAKVSHPLLGLVEHVATQLESAQLAYGHGTTNAFDEAAWLVLWKLGLPLDTALDDNALLDFTLTAQQRSDIDALVAQRISTRKPAAYLTHEAWLQGISFYCDERAIVPRSFIAELLADGSIDPWLSDKTQQVLDLCTGNGSLAVLAALAYPDVDVTASDISEAALQVAAINIDRHDLRQRIQLVQSDGLNQLAGPFDLVLCNPPYVNENSMGLLPAEYTAEPRLALAGGVDGMDFIGQLLTELAQKMTPEGVLVLEIGNERANFERAFRQLPVHWMPTSAGADQVLLIERDDLIEAFDNSKAK